MSRTPPIRAAAPRPLLLTAGRVELEAGDGAPLRRFRMLAYTGGAMVLPGYDRPVVVDLAGVEVPSQRLPILRQHDMTRIIGHTEAVEVTTSIDARGIISGTGADASEVMASADNGFPWQASIGANPTDMETVDQGMTAQANGRTFEGPLYVARRSVLKEISFVPIGADGATAAVLAGARLTGATMKFEDWLLTLGFDKGAKMTDVQRANLMQLYAKEYPDGEGGAGDPAEPPALGMEDEDKDKMKAEGTEDEDKKKVIPAADPLPALRASAAAEITRQAEITRLCASAGNPTITASNRVAPIAAHAIAENWSAQRTELELLRRQRETAGPYLASHSHDQSATLQAMQGAMILRAGGRLDHPAYQTRQAVGIGLPAWLRAGINAEARQRAMEAAHHYADMSMVDLCREALRLDGRTAPTSRREMIQAAFSGSALTNIFTTNINALVLATYVEHPDTTQGWVRETEANDFRTMDRIRLAKGSSLAKLPRGSEADHESRSDSKESYKIARYARQFVVDEQDVIDDYFNALADVPNEMGLAAARLRPDLVYSILKANDTLGADSVALFDNSTHANTDTSAALAADKLKAGVTAIRLQQDNGVNLNLAPTHLIVPQTLEFTGRELVQSTVLIIAGTAGSVTERGNLNTIQSVGLNVVADSRLDNGVTDPDSGTVHPGDVNDWFLAAASAYGIEVAYLRGTGRSPQTRSFMLERGKWGVGWDVNMDVGAKALDYRGLYRGQG